MEFWPVTFLLSSALFYFLQKLDVDREFRLQTEHKDSTISVSDLQNQQSFTVIQLMSLVFAFGAGIFGMLNYIIPYAGDWWIPFFIVIPSAVAILIFGAHFRVFRFSSDREFVVGTKRDSSDIAFMIAGHVSYLWPIFPTFILIIGNYATPSAQMLTIPLVTETIFFSYFIPIQILPKKF